jgi:hypothetical protein
MGVVPAGPCRAVYTSGCWGQGQFFLIHIPNRVILHGLHETWHIATPSPQNVKIFFHATSRSPISSPVYRTELFRQLFYRMIAMLRLLGLLFATIEIYIYAFATISPWTHDH